MSSHIRIIEADASKAPSENLVLLEPKETNRRLVETLPEPVKACLRKTHHPGYEFKDFEIEGLPATEHLGAVKQAIASHEYAMRPAPSEPLKKALARLRVMTKTRSDEEGEGALRAAAYLEELQHWPGDVAMHVLNSQPRIDKWWPAWAELEERLELYARERKKRLQALVDLSQRMMVRDVVAASEGAMTAAEIEAAVGISGLSVTLWHMTQERWDSRGRLLKTGNETYHWETR